jgi:peptidoglycan/xylan/chitin deacetylase (PgdA/CDA1 family)
MISGISYRLIRLIGNLIAPKGIGQGRLCIINYHRILESSDPLIETEPDIKTFRKEMQLLANCFNVLPLHDAVQIMKSKRMPPRAVCITFDDGYRSTHDYALPILKEFNLPATVFITTGYMKEGNMWNDRIIEAVRRLPFGDYNLHEARLGTVSIYTLQDRKLAIQTLIDESKYLPHQSRLNLTLLLEKYAGGIFNTGHMLTREMVYSLSHEGIEIGGHTITHPILTSLTDEEARYEITESKRQLEEITGKPVRLFAYPNGKVGMDFDERHVAMAKESGFTAAFTTAIGAASNTDNLFQLPRSRPWDTNQFLFCLRLLRWLAK